MDIKEAHEEFDKLATDQLADYQRDRQIMNEIFDISRRIEERKKRMLALLLHTVGQ